MLIVVCTWLRKFSAVMQKKKGGADGMEEMRQMEKFRFSRAQRKKTFCAEKNRLGRKIRGCACPLEKRKNSKDGRTDSTEKFQPGPSIIT